VTSRTTERFRKAFRKLPPTVQRQAKAAYHLWRDNPSHPSLQFKRIHSREPIYSVRIGIGWRAVGVRSDDTVVWFWIGSHAEYDKLLSNL
jgi:mRNA-degrading endonuclease RelE of RelBE toxin-antitoxin system